MAGATMASAYRVYFAASISVVAGSCSTANDNCRVTGTPAHLSEPLRVFTRGLAYVRQRGLLRYYNVAAERAAHGPAVVARRALGPRYNISQRCLAPWLLAGC